MHVKGIINGLLISTKLCQLFKLLWDRNDNDKRNEIIKMFRHKIH